MKFRRNHRFLKKSLGICLTAALCISAAAGIPCVNAKAETPDANPQQLAENCQDGTILHCFCWPYADITKELPKIAAAGFTSIQVTSVQWCALAVTDPYIMTWSYVYNPVGFKVMDSEMPSGYTRASLAELCSEADKYGIKIIMDVVANHNLRGVTRPTDQFFDNKYWHNNGPVLDYSDRYQVTQYDSGGLNDLCTENEDVQKAVVDYLADLESLGVDGIRWDSAKHIALPSEGDTFWPTVTNNNLYHYGEILNGPVDGEQNKDKAFELMKEYTDYMSVTDNKYGYELLAGFRKGEAAECSCGYTDKGMSADKFIFWGESHDTYANDVESFGDECTKYIDQNLVDRAYAVVTAREGSSSLYFSRPSEKENYMITNCHKGSSHFESPEISAVNHFHNAMTGKKDCTAVSDNCQVVTRENGGAVIVCGSGSGEVEVVNAGGYAVPGTYIDEVSGNTFVVTNDTIKGTVGESGIAVIYGSSDAGSLYAEAAGKLTDGLTTLHEKTDIKLYAPSMKSASYKLTYTDKNNEVKEITKDFADGDIITVGEDCIYNSIITLELTGTTINDKTISSAFEYAFVPAPSTEELMPNILIFDNSMTGWDDVYIYAYAKTDDGLIENAAYPGEKPYNGGIEYYGYSLPDKFDGCDNVYIIFNDGKGSQISEATNSKCVTGNPGMALYVANYWMAGLMEQIEETPTGHNHTIKTVAAVDPTETTDGNIEYYTCDDCKKMFSDAAGLFEITDASSVIIPKKEPSQESSEPSQESSQPSKQSSEQSQEISKPSEESKPEEHSDTTPSLPPQPDKRDFIETGDSGISTILFVSLISSFIAAAAVLFRKKSKHN